jgi:MerR family transcriptional regulator, light-induced transcriptional regulator
LRTWETRYGVPAAARGPGGHRRYRAADVAVVLQILRQRANGYGMAAAVERATSEVPVSETSVFAGLRRGHEELSVQLLAKPTLLALCRAIEDECCAQADRPLLFASFQRERHYRASETRWKDLSRTARGAFVFADFDDLSPEARQPPVAAQPTLVPVPAQAPFNREWVLVCDSEDYPGLVVGWERPGQAAEPDRLRRFETIWSLDPPVVRAAARVCARLTELYVPAARFPFWGDLEATPLPASAEARRATRVVDRMLSYLSRRS